MTSLPLTGRRILVTRAAKQAGKLSEGLRSFGAIPIEVPVLEIRPPESFAPLDAALQGFTGYDWLILTSANAVHVLAERASRAGISLQEPASPKVAVVGASTAAEVEKLSLKVDLIPGQFVAESLIAELKVKVSGTRILLVRAAVARDVIPDALRAAGATVDIADAYRNAMPAAAPEQLRQALAQGIDAATFTSSSSAMHLAEAAKQAAIAFPFPGVPAISIGPVTSQTLCDLDWPPAAEANPSDIPGLIAAVARVLAS